MFLRNGSGESSPGRAVMFLGIGLIAISLIVIGINAVLGTEPMGRAATLSVIGLPLGLVAVITGIILALRSRSGD